MILLYVQYDFLINIYSLHLPRARTLLLLIDFHPDDMAAYKVLTYFNKNFVGTCTEQFAPFINRISTCNCPAAPETVGDVALPSNRAAKIKVYIS